ncbi:MAG: endonuclease/exonuclease/phosphatase family protein [Pseudomonadota bacterium]
MKILSLNINRHEQRSRQRVLLRNEDADILCLQEVTESCFSELCDKGYAAFFAPQWYETYENITLAVGCVIATKHPVTYQNTFYFRGDADAIPDFRNGAIAQESIPRAVQTLCLGTVASDIYIHNLHFTWSANGVPSDLQRDDARKISDYVVRWPNHVIAGDFNTPIGGEIFRLICGDALPATPKDLTTTIDKRFHYSGGVDIVVDSIATSPSVMAHDTRAVFGVSDHCALLADIRLRPEN